MIYNQYMVGVLASDERTQDEINKQAIFFDPKTLGTIFFIERISKSSCNLPSELKLFSATGASLEAYGFEESYAKSDSERREEIIEFFSEKLIVFKPRRKVNKKDEYSVDYDNIKIIMKPKHYSNEYPPFYHPVPIFTPKNSAKDWGTFLDRIKLKKAIGVVDGISNEVHDTPKVIMWKDTTKKEYKLISGFTSHTYIRGNYDSNGFLLEYDDFQKLAIMDFNQEWYHICIESDDVLFMEEEIMGSLAVANGQDLLLRSRTRSMGFEQGLELLSKEESSDENELEFIEEFIKKTRAKGFLYSERDLVNFHTAMKSSKLVILSGMSGTGKSKLVDLYAQALGISERLKVIPVRPSWTDDADLLGYVDTMHNLYKPSDSGLVDILKNASSDKLYIVCFDEMNLARVEHYFSQFLSVLEHDLNRREIRLYSDQLESKLYNSADYPPTIQIGNNILFVGTVNMDESTYNFSDKVLDRANVIELEVLPFKELISISHESAEAAVNAIKPRGLNFYNKFRVLNDDILLTEEELSFLQELFTIFKQVNGKGFGYRVVRQINNYLKLLPETPYLSRGEAFDFQIVQRILTKLRGSELELNTIVGSYSRMGQEDSQGLLGELFKRYFMVSDFKHCQATITLKARELMINGYTI